MLYISLIATTRLKPIIETQRGKENEKGTKELQNIQKTINERVVVSPYLSVVTLNISGLNSPVKRHRVA